MQNSAIVHTLRVGFKIYEEGSKIAKHPYGNLAFAIVSAIFPAHSALKAISKGRVSASGFHIIKSITTFVAIRYIAQFMRIHAKLQTEVTRLGDTSSKLSAANIKLKKENTEAAELLAKRGEQLKETRTLITKEEASLERLREQTAGLEAITARHEEAAASLKAENNRQAELIAENVETTATMSDEADRAARETDRLQQAIKEKAGLEAREAALATRAAQVDTKAATLDAKAEAAAAASERLSSTEASMKRSAAKIEQFTTKHLPSIRMALNLQQIHFAIKAQQAHKAGNTELARGCAAMAVQARNALMSLPAAVTA